jgi:hypothetical protein
MDVAALTQLLHGSPHPLWARLREVLGQKGLQLEATALAWSSEEGPSVEFGILATRERRVFQYLLVEDELAEWQDLSGSWEGTPYSNSVRSALSVLARSQR